MVPGGGGPNNPNNFLTLPAAGAPGGGRRSGNDDQQSSSKENKPDQVAWAAKILQEYTNTKGSDRSSKSSKLKRKLKRGGSSRRGSASDTKSGKKEGGENGEGEEEEDTGFYGMCYMPIVWACILVGALMIGLVIYFVEGNSDEATTVDPPADGGQNSNTG